MSDPREWLDGILPKVSEKNEKAHAAREARIDEIINGFAEMYSTVWAVEHVGAHMGIETVEVYGLEITLDGYGNAAEVRFPYGASVTE